MKKVIITSSKFPGEIYLLYGTDMKLMQIDFSNVQHLDDKKINYLKNCTPPILYQEIAECYNAAAGLEFTLEGYEVSWEMFWNKYARKINEARCKLIWNKMNVAEQQKAFAGIDVYNRHLAREAWKNKADPETYLKKQYWNNEWK